MSIFREYDIRGIFEKDLTQEIVFKVGYHLGQIIRTHAQEQVLIGYDARTHSTILLEWLSDGLFAGGVEVLHLGQIPTPVAYFATYALECKNSIMITGSHNPPQYNGFKITIDQKPFYGAAIQNLKDTILACNTPYQRASTTAKQVNILESYIAHLTEHFGKLRDFPYPIALDYGNGVGALAMKPILENLNIKHYNLFDTPDGTFPNHHPDPSEEENLNDLKTAMKEQNIPIALAFDGDADRIALLTSHHSYKGDELAIFFAQEMAREMAPKKPLIIGEVKCSQIMYDTINKLGKSLMYKTGHSNLKVKLKELNADLAVEMSGHIFFNDRYYGYDDAIYAGLRILELFLTQSPKDLESAIAALPKVYSTPEEKIHTTEEAKFSLISSLKSKLKNPPASFPPILDIIDIDGVRVIFQDGWGLVRASNTTPVLVTRFEAKDEATAMLYKKALLDLLPLNPNS